MRNLKRLVMICASIVLLCGCSAETAREVTVYEVETTRATETDSYTETQELPSADLVLLEHTESGQIDIVTAYCTLSFPDAYRDLLEVKFVDDGMRGALDFYARLTVGSYPAFTVSFSGKGESRLGTLEFEGGQLDVYVTFAEESGDLSEDDRLSFRAAQEQFNEIWESLTANERFSPVE